MLDETFRFAGIGVSRDKIIELIDLFDEENSIKFIP